MRHHNTNRKLGRERGQRRALLKSLIKNLVLKESIKTTEAKAKELRKFIEPIVTKAKNDTLSNRRLVASKVYNDKKVVEKLFGEIGPLFAKRAGGYTQILKLPPRKSDGSKMAIIQFVK